MPRRWRCWILCIPLFFVSWIALATPLTPGSVLVSFGSDFIGEFSRDGTLLQGIRVPYPGPDRPNTETVRDIVLNSDGTLAIFNGTFHPYMTVWNPTDNSFTSDTLSGWVSDGNGAIATLKNFVFVADNSNPTGSTSGVVRFDRSSPGTAQRFHSIYPYDLAIGLDGLLYVLGVDEKTVEVFDPQTMTPLRTLALPRQIFSITANADGDIIGAYNMGGLVEFDPLGNLLTLVPGLGLGDVVLGSDGAVLGQTIFPQEVFLADQNLTGSAIFEDGAGRFVAFGLPPGQPVSEPPSLALVTLILALAWIRARRGCPASGISSAAKSAALRSNSRTNAALAPSVLATN
jgi:hypothetical protein